MPAGPEGEDRLTATGPGTPPYSVAGEWLDAGTLASRYDAQGGTQSMHAAPLIFNCTSGVGSAALNPSVRASHKWAVEAKRELGRYNLSEV
jgi:hypothetical protein